MSSSPQYPNVLHPEDIFSLKDGLIVIGCEYLFWGIYMTLATIVLYLLINEGLAVSRARKFFVVIILIMLASSTTISVIRIMFQIKLVDVYGPVPYDPSSLITTIVSISNCLERLNYFLSDTIVVWRAWVLWTQSWKVKAVLAFCIAASGVAVIIDGTLTVLEEVNASGLALPTGADTLILTLPLLITNILSTLFVGLKAWEYRREVRMRLSHTSSYRIMESMLILLVESGFVYCALWIVVLLARYRVFGDLAFDVVLAVFPHLTGIYPVLIIMLVAIEKKQEAHTTYSTNTAIRFNSVVRGTTSMDDTVGGSTTFIPMPKEEQNTKYGTSSAGSHV